MIRLAATEIAILRSGRKVLDSVSLLAAGGEFVALIGPNGAGKTTLLKALAGLEAPAKGHVTINGAEAHALAPRRRARLVSYLPQAREVAWAITAEAVVALGRFAYGTPQRLSPGDRAAVDRALAATDAEIFRVRTMPTLSGGEHARVHLARALAAETPLLLADEPTAALDPRHANAIMGALAAKAEAGGLVIAALHDLRLAQRFCTRTVVLDLGAVIADDAPGNALTPALLHKVFGVCDL